MLFHAKSLSYNQLSLRNGHHLFTRHAALRALQAGAILAARLDDVKAAEWYAKMAMRVEARLANFWIDDEEGQHNGFWASSIGGKNQFGQPPQASGEEVHEAEDMGSILKGLDCGFCLAVIHTGSRRAPNTSTEFSWSSLEPSHPGVLSTLRSYVKSFEGEYEINSGKATWTDGWLVGRYANDKYDGVGMSKGNPWFICTQSVANVLYLAHQSYTRAGVITYSHHTVDFWADVMGLVIEGEGDWVAGSELYEKAMKRLWRLADLYLSLAHEHAGPDGEMSEQIDR